MLYDSLASNITNFHATTRASWESELNTDMTDQQWDTALNLVHSSSFYTHHCLIQCKVLHKVHYTNAKLSKIYSTVSDTCNRCKQSPVNHIHMFWSYPTLSSFWESVFDIISKAYTAKLSVPIHHQPSLAYLLTPPSLLL